MPLRKWTAVLAMSALLVLAGCKKKPKTVPPPQAQAPTIQTPAQPPATEQPAPAPAPPPATTNQPSTTTPATSETTAKNKPARRPRPTRRPAPEKETPATAEKEPAPKTGAQIARNTPPAAPPAPITATLPPDQVLHTRGTTEQLLQSTEQNLAAIRRALSTVERDMVEQARVYITQSRSATQDGDSARAYNLAMKAHLLSDELIKQ